MKPVRHFLRRIFVNTSVGYIGLILLIWLFFSSPFFIHGKTPFPADYQVNFFQPWTMYEGLGGPVKNNAQSDIITQIYPWKYFTISELKQGSIPFWNPYSFAGTPHLANYQSAVLSPMNLLFILPIEFVDAWGLLVLLQPLLAGVFTFLYCRSVNISKIGSLVSAISFMFCGFMVVWMGYATIGYAILFLPLALLFIEKFKQSLKYRYLVFFALCFPLSFFSGHFQTSLYFLLLVLSYITCGLIFSGKKRENFLLLFFCVCGLLLCMPQILPTLELFLVSVRGVFEGRVSAIPLSYFPTILAPDFYGNPVTRNDWFGYYAEWQGYAGVVPFVLAVYAVVVRTSRKITFFAVMGTIALLLAYETPLQHLLVVLNIPVLSSSALSRVIVIFSFSIAILSGFGIDNLLSKKPNIRQAILSLIIVMAFFVGAGGLLVFGDFESDKISVAVKNIILPLVLTCTVCFILVSLHFLRNKKFKHIAIAIIVVMVMFEMLRYATKWQSFSEKEMVYADVPIINFYNQTNHIDRAIGLSGAEDSVYYRVPILTGYDPLYKTEYGELIEYINTEKISGLGKSTVAFPYKGVHTPEAIDMLGVRWIVHKVSDKNYSWAFPFKDYPKDKFSLVYQDEGYQVYENHDYWKRSYLTTNVIVAERQRILSEILPAKSQNLAVIEKKLNLDKDSKGEVKINKYSPNNVIVDVDSDGRQLLVLTDNYYPGWKVRVNGENAELIKVNYSFRGVVVPKGISMVEFSYIPDSFLIGFYLAMLGLLGFVVILVLKALSIKK